MKEWRGRLDSDRHVTWYRLDQSNPLTHRRSTNVPIACVLGVLLIQIGVWRAATAPRASTPPDAVSVTGGQTVTPEAAFAGLIVAAILFWWSATASYAGWRATPRTESVQLIAGVLLYLSGRAGPWPLARMFGATVGLLALYVLVSGLR